MQQILEAKYPETITTTPIWTILDSTKLKAFMICPRLFFYNYVLGWIPEHPNVHLEFGSAWHEAMEHLLNNGYSDESVAEAYLKFFTYYRKYFTEADDLDNGAKEPGNAMQALMEYVDYYKHDNFDVLYTEIAGSVPVTEEFDLTFKIDGIIRDDDGIKVLEHKTASQDSDANRKQWLLNVQPGTYCHALYCLYPETQVYGAVINITVLRKKGNLFQRVPIRMGRDQMAVWQFNAEWYLNLIKHNFQCLSECSLDDHIMRAFPMNTESCTKYGLCQYHAYCNAWTNPLQRCGEPQPGFKVKHWNPRDKQEDANYIVNGGEVKKNERTGKTTGREDAVSKIRPDQAGTNARSVEYSEIGMPGMLPRPADEPVKEQGQSDLLL